MSWICPKCETENPDRLTICEVCDSPRERSHLDKLKEKYSNVAYKFFIQHHYDLLASADHGNSIDQYHVGEWFFERSQTKPSVDYDKIAVSWFLAAAQQGHISAQYKIALCYEEGRGVPQSKDAAIKWYKAAAREGEEMALHKYLKLKYSSKTYEAVIRYRLALLSAADSGISDSQYLLGEWFRCHNSQSSYREEAVIWYTKAANSGHVEAMLRLGDCYENGYGVNSNIYKALEWYTKAANGGNRTACLKLAKSYLYGSMVNKDVGAAVKWFNMVGDGLSGADLCNIGYAYDVGDSVPMNKSKAVEYYRKAADKDDMVAQYNLGVCYENGYGVDRNVDYAKYWYGKAAANGHTDAARNLDHLKMTSTYTTDRNVDFFDDCLFPAVTISAIILFVYQLIAAFASWPVLSIKNGLFIEENMIPALIFIIPTIILTLWFYSEENF